MPASELSSSGRKRRMTPYSPSKPASRITSSFRSRRIASTSADEPTSAIASSGTSARIPSSGPSRVVSVVTCAATALLFGPTPRISPTTSGSATSERISPAVGGRNPSVRSASVSTRCRTPTVSARPHCGQRPSACRV